MQKFRYQLIVGKLIVIFNTIVGSVAVLIILQLMSVCSELFHSGGN